jgi:hypothetical protein
MTAEAFAALIALTGRVIVLAAWTMVLILAAFIVMQGLGVHDGSLVAADERLARAIASPFKFLNGIHLRQGWL